MLFIGRIPRKSRNLGKNRHVTHPNHTRQNLVVTEQFCLVVLRPKSKHYRKSLRNKTARLVRLPHRSQFLLCFLLYSSHPTFGASAADHTPGNGTNDEWCRGWYQCGRSDHCAGARRTSEGVRECKAADAIAAKWCQQSVGYSADRQGIARPATAKYVAI